MAVADIAEKWGIKYFRSQLFKPRTSPYSFQGLGEGGLPIVKKIQDRGLSPVCEACSVEHLKVIESYADIIQIGARNMQNFELLKNVGISETYQKRKPYVLLKRGFANTIDEWLKSATYLEESGVPAEKIILCERGSRNYTSPHGVVLDLGLAYKVKLESNYKVVIDPSHGSKHSSLVLPLAKAAMAMNFDGVMIEVHPRPLESVSDPLQAISIEDMDSFMKELASKK